MQGAPIQLSRNSKTDLLDRGCLPKRGIPNFPNAAPWHHGVAVAGGIAQREAHGGGRFRDAGLEIDLDGLGSGGKWADGLSQKKKVIPEMPEYCIIYDDFWQL